MKKSPHFRGLRALRNVSDRFFLFPGLFYQRPQDNDNLSRNPEQINQPGFDIQGEQC